MKNLFLFIFVLISLFSIFNFVSAQEKQIEINFFYSRTCPHCAKESNFLDEIEEKYPEVKINRFEVSKKENIEHLMGFYSSYDVSLELRGLVPITFVEERYFSGFDNDIKREIETCILGKLEQNHQEQCQCQKCFSEQSTQINLPLVGKVDIGEYSLPVLSVVLGFLDGFNVCSLGALILILGLVLTLKSRKKILLFGGLFILTTAFVYGALIIIWYQIFSFLTPYLKIMEILIGLLALIGAGYFLKEFLRMRKKGAACDMGTGKKFVSRFSSKFQQLIDPVRGYRDRGEVQSSQTSNGVEQSKNILLVSGLILIFAAIITIVEFPCSAAIPVVFAGILAKSNLSAFSYLFYIAFFLFFYMLDEIIVFLIAFFTMKIWLASSKATIWITLIEALVLFIMGVYYLFGFSFLI